MSAATSRALVECHEDARQVARFIREGGHEVQTARIFTPKGKAGAVVLLDGGGRITYWTDRKKPEERGRNPFVNCLWCGERHVRCTDGKSYVNGDYLFLASRRSDGFPCMRARFVQKVVRSFPSLQNAPHCMPWDPAKFASWARNSESLTSGSVHAARFVLAVWKGSSEEWKGLHFDAVKAMAAWDWQHKEAFLRWCQNPWWP